MLTDDLLGHLSAEERALAEAAQSVRGDSYSLPGRDHSWDVYDRTANPSFVLALLERFAVRTAALEQIAGLSHTWSTVECPACIAKDTLAAPTQEGTDDAQTG